MAAIAHTRTYRLLIVVIVATMFAALLPGGLLRGQAADAAEPNKVSFTLEGCRTPVGDLSQSDFLCEAGEGGTYTTGNLGKGWNELDLVPHRLTASAGNAAPETQTYTIGITADHQESGVAGYDIISVPVLNTDLSHASCQLGTITGGATGQVITPGVGGTDSSLGRLVTITQDKNSTCVIDWVERLALGSAQYPGASLHTNATNEQFSTQGMGARDVSIPVNEILPQELSKTMTATRGSDHVWQLTKEANPVSLQFANTCLGTTGAREAPVQVTVSWTKLDADPSGVVTILTTVTATNPAHRPVLVKATDRIYEGNDQSTLLDTKEGDFVEVGANSFEVVLTHVFEVDSESTTFNDVATAEYKDLQFPDIAIPGQTEATASATVSLTGPVSNETATIIDTESITGAGLDFKVAAPSVGAFTNYTAGSWTTGPVGWKLEDTSTSGSVTFNKTVRVDGPRITSGTLSDTVTLTGSDGFFVQDSASTTISSSALVEIQLVKEIPDVVSSGESISITFELRDDADTKVDEVTLTFYPGETVKSHTFSGLAPGVYTLVETDSGGFAPQAAPVVVDMSPAADGTVDCFESRRIVNGFEPAQVQVRKHTLPAGNEAGWTFTLSGPELGLPEGLTTTSDQYHLFQTLIETDGTYTVTETAQGGWDLTKVELNGQEVAGTVCQFTLDFPADGGQLISCDFTNVQRGTIIVEKDVVSNDPTAVDESFTFTGDASGSIRDTSTHDERITVSNLVPGTYTSTETDPTPDFDLTAINCDDGGSTTPSTTSLGSRTATFELDPGETITCTFTNTERATVEVIKTSSGLVPPAGAFTFELRQGASSTEEGTTLATDSNDGLGVVDFGGIKLVPGTYQVCETAVLVGWDVEWPAGYTPFVPNSDDSEHDNSTQCVDVVLGPGDALSLNVNNVPPPGGEARTIGFWRNWSGDCTNGNQADVLGDTLMEAGGILIGDLLVDDACNEAVPLLAKSDIATGKKRANDAAYGLAAQLLAARLNIVADAGTCTAANDAMAAGQELLDHIDFDGSGSYLGPKVRGHDAEERAAANQLASILDAYNNNELCT